MEERDDEDRKNTSERVGQSACERLSNIYIYIYIHMYICIYIYTNICMYTYIYMHTYICMYTYVYMYTHINIETSCACHTRVSKNQIIKIDTPMSSDVSVLKKSELTWKK